MRVQNTLGCLFGFYVFSCLVFPYQRAPPFYHFLEGPILIRIFILGQTYCFFGLISFQNLRLTALMNGGPTDTQSVSTTRPTAVSHVSAPMGRFTASVNRAPLPHAHTRSHGSAVGAAKVDHSCIKRYLHFSAVTLYPVVL